MIANGPPTSPAWRPRACLGGVIAYDMLLVLAMIIGAASTVPGPLIAVVCGKTEAMPWMSLVIGDRPYATMAGVIASKARDASGSTTSATENIRPYGFNTSFSEAAAAGVLFHGSPAMSKLPPALL